jgi:predicted porin
MKRSLFLAAMATLTSGAALAQSSVTIYGRLNESVERVKDGDTSTTQVVDNSSRIGFKGTEDLGGGLKAFFLIEHGFSADTGRAAATFWGRESNVGIEGSFGKVRLGNMGPTAAYFTTADYISMHNHDTGNSSDAFYFYQGNAQNTIAYTTPTFSGLNVEAQLGLAENSGLERTVVLAANYVGGPLHLGASYLTGPDNSGLGGEKAKQFGIRALYELGAFTLGAYWINDKIEDPGVEAKRNSYRLSGMYAMGANEFHLNYGAAGETEVGNTTVIGKSSQFTLGYNYNLSKRTKVYAFYTQVDNKAGASYYTSVAGTKFSSIAAGLRHNF